MNKIVEIKEYWEKNTPQHWYSEKKIGTREYYDEIQEYRYNVAYPYIPKLVEFQKVKNQKVLEIGCGQGTDLLQFAKYGAEVYGVDLTEAAIHKTRDIFKLYGLGVKLNTINAENMSLFDDNYFDVVYSFGVIHHTPNTEEIIEEIHRIIKPGGQTYIMIYAKGLNYLIKLFLYHIIYGGFFKQDLQTTINKNTEYSRNCPLTKMYSKKAARILFKKFRNISVIKLHNPLLNSLVPVHILKAFGAIFGDNLFITGNK